MREHAMTTTSSTSVAVIVRLIGMIANYSKMTRQANMAFNKSLAVIIPTHVGAQIRIPTPTRYQLGYPTRSCTHSLRATCNLQMKTIQRRLQFWSMRTDLLDITLLHCHGSIP